MDARMSMSQEKREQFDKMARELVRGSIIEKAAVRFVAQIIAECAAIRSGTDTDYVCVKREWLENEILPLVEEAEFLQSQAFSYGDCGAEPSPPEWGIAVGYQQLNPDRSCAEMYEADVRKFHQDNAEEDDGDGEFLTVANRLRSLLKEKGGENG